MTHNHAINRNQSVMYITVSVIFPVLALCAIPLILSFVNSDSYFGMSLPAAFGNTEEMFALNAFMVRAAVGCSGLLFLLHLLVGRKVRECCYAVYTVAMVLGSILVPLGMTFLFINAR